MSLGEKLTTIAENMKDVYGRGYVGGYSEGQEEGYKTGYSKGNDEGVASGFEGGYQQGYQDAQTEDHRAFWDNFQDKGARTNYQYAFIGTSWSFKNFYPAYDIVPQGNASSCFFNWSNGERHYDSLKKRLALCGVSLDTSRVVNMQQIFSNTNITELPAISMVSATGTTRAFYSSTYLHTIDKIIVSERTQFDRCFEKTPALVNVVFEGVIAQNGLDLSGSTKLSYASLRSVVDCLMEYSGGTHSLVLGAANLSKLTQADKDAAAQKGWTLS